MPSYQAALHSEREVRSCHRGAHACSFEASAPSTTFSADSLLVTSPSSPPSGILCGAWRWSVSECSTSIKGGGSVLGRGGAAAHRGSRAEGLFKQRRAELGPSFHPSRNQTALAHPSQIPIRYTLRVTNDDRLGSLHTVDRARPAPGVPPPCFAIASARLILGTPHRYTPKRGTHTQPRPRGLDCAVYKLRVSRLIISPVTSLARLPTYCPTTA